MGRILVADIMTREPATAKPTDDLLKCAKKMVRKKVGSLILTEKNKLVGFINQKDILWALVKKSKENLSSVKAIDISPRKIVTIQPYATIEEAISKMKKSKFKRLPVVRGNELLGVVTVKDILNFHPEFYPELDELKKIKEESKKLKKLKKAKNRNFVHRGVCEQCGKTDILYKVHGMLICEYCKNSI